MRNSRGKRCYMDDRSTKLQKKVISTLKKCNEVKTAFETVKVLGTVKAGPKPERSIVEE